MCSKRYDHIVMPGPASNSDFGVRIHTWWAPASTRSLGILLENLRWWVCLDWAYFCWNWKHCSEIIFKCVNNVVGPIFNKNITKKCNLWDRKQYTYILFIVDKVNYCGLEKKKKEENVEKKRRRWFHCKPKVMMTHIDTGMQLHWSLDSSCTIITTVHLELG